MQRFIVGTGRCGSTLLSSLLAHHPDALVLSEFFGGLDLVRGFDSGIVDGDTLAAILMQDHAVSNLNRMRRKVDHEILINLDAYESPRIPAIMLVCLAALTDDPDALMREIVGWARAQTPAELGTHYTGLFDWLTKLFGKAFWVERSGGSGEFFPGLRRTFPEARFLHLHRDGAESAMSMANQNHFRTHVSFYFDPPEDAELIAAIRREEGQEGLIVRRMNNLRPPEDFGTFWTLSISLICSELKSLRPDQYCEVRFEDFRADPASFLEMVCGYFEIPSDRGWIDTAIATIRPENNQRAAQLSDAERSALDRAVFPGQVLLKRAATDRPNRQLFGHINRIWDEIDPRKAFVA